MDPSLLASLTANGYNTAIAAHRSTEYPQLSDHTFLDHASCTLPSRSALTAFATDLSTSLYSNPHSQSPSSQATTTRIDAVRLRVLQFFNADPAEFDIIFTANATAGIKLVADGFSTLPEGVRYLYHGDAHTSIIGARGLAQETRCLAEDSEVEQWLREPAPRCAELFAWPAQSNFTGRRLPSWSAEVRARGCYSLLDAAALVPTAPLDLSDAHNAPDFTVLSFTKMFGFPDLGGLLVRRGAAGVLAGRRYFGGGTVDACAATEEGWVRRKGPEHEGLEDGTLPFHSILALDAAMDAYTRLYGSPRRVQRHVGALGTWLDQKLRALRHANGEKVCLFYSGELGNDTKQGPIIAFNMRRADGVWVGYAEVEKLFAVKKLHVRVGGMCNPGGIEKLVGLSVSQLKANYAAGHKCSDDNDVLDGQPTGAVRVSLGAMSTLDDAQHLLRTIEEFYVQHSIPTPVPRTPSDALSHTVVEALTIYPIKSCAGFSIPPHTPWPIKPHGLAYDREFCLFHLGTSRALSQKQYPRMVFIRPSLNPACTLLTVAVHNSPQLGTLEIPLASAPTCSASPGRVCGEDINAYTYDDARIIAFFSKAVGVPCTLARFPPESTERNYKPHLAAAAAQMVAAPRTPKILLSNESPILLVNASSVDALNDQIAATGGKAASAAVFRGNITVRAEMPWVEDTWHTVQIGGQILELLGACRRCHMVCIDQQTAEKDEEPFCTLSKVRRRDGKVLFGQHTMHLGSLDPASTAEIMVGDKVVVRSTLPEQRVIPSAPLPAAQSSRSNSSFFQDVKALVTGFA